VIEACGAVERAVLLLGALAAAG